MKKYIYWILFVFLKTTCINAQYLDTVNCKQMQGRFIQLNQEFQYEFNSVRFYLGEINSFLVNHLILYKEKASIEDMYRQGVFWNVWSHTDVLSMIGKDCSPDSYFNEILQSLPDSVLYGSCYYYIGLSFDRVSYSSSRTKTVWIKSSKYWKRKLKGRWPSYCFYNCTFSYIEGDECEVTIPNYNYHWWMSRKKKVIKLKTKIYKITSIDNCSIEEE